MDSVSVMMFEMARMQKNDPRGFYLMIGCVTMLAFLALTIFGGFIYYLYRGSGKPKSD